MTSLALSEECGFDCSEFIGKCLTLSLEMAFWYLRPIEFEDQTAQVTVFVTSVSDTNVGYVPSYIPENVDYVLMGYLIRNRAVKPVTFWMSKEVLLSQLS